MFKQKFDARLSARSKKKQLIDVAKEIEKVNQEIEEVKQEQEPAKQRNHHLFPQKAKGVVPMLKVEEAALPQILDDSVESTARMIDLSRPNVDIKAAADMMSNMSSEIDVKEQVMITLESNSNPTSAERNKEIPSARASKIMKTISLNFA